MYKNVRICVVATYRRLRRSRYLMSQSKSVILYALVAA